MGGTGTKGGAKQTPRGVTIRSNKTSESLQIDFIYKGVRCRESLRLSPTASNIKYAAGLLGEIQRKIGSESFRYQDYFPDSPKAKLFGYSVTKVTVGDRLRQQLKGYEHATANDKMSPSTLNGYRKIIEGRLIPEFDSYQLRLLAEQPSIIRTWVSGLGVTAKTARNILSPLRSMFDDAINDQMIEQNPLDKIALKKLLVTTSKKSDYVVDPFDDLEEQAILSSCDGHAKNLFQFALWSGLRTSELIALQWGDIDWVHGLVRVHRAVVVKTEKGTKTEAGTRDVLMLPKAMEALKAQKELTFLADGRVFYNPRTNEPWETDGQIRKTCWTHVLKKAGVRYRNPYQMRHTYASRLLSAGENPWWVANQMGHADVEMVFKVYGKWIPTKASGQYKPVNDWSDQNDTQTTRRTSNT
jgi:integrase